MNNKKTNYTVPALVILVLFFGLTVFNVFSPKKAYIDSERRPAAEMR